MNIFKKIKYFFMYQRAISMANNAYHTTGNRHYVMPTPQGKLMVTDRANFRLLKRKHYINPNATLGHLTAECFYHTPHRGGTHAMHPTKVKAQLHLYWQWAQLFEKRKKQHKKK